ncbi:MAG: GNAT family N-acetyltransferase, partial [Myxococcales bacterium]|nr:GNAT family N-acetyltransferase [Myxococcales bacterium]
AAHAPPRDLATLDFQPLTEAFIDPVIALKHRIFAAHPEYCWFGADPRFLAREAAGMRAELAAGRCFDEIILREGRLVGFIGLGIQHGNAFWGSTGGLDLVLDPEIQGQGVVKTAYRRVLERLVAEGVAVFKGGTSQPAVLALGRRMGRVMASVNVRHATPFSASHFGDWL